MENKKEPHHGNGRIPPPSLEEIELLAKSQSHLLALLARAVADRFRKRSPKVNSSGDAEDGGYPAHNTGES